jgi:hypothetical protein
VASSIRRWEGNCMVVNVCVVRERVREAQKQNSEASRMLMPSPCSHKNLVSGQQTREKSIMHTRQCLPRKGNHRHGGAIQPVKCRSKQTTGQLPSNGHYFSHWSQADPAPHFLSTSSMHCFAVRPISSVHAN